MNAERTLRELVDACLAWQDAHGAPIPFARICQAHPELQGEVERAVEVALRLPAADRAALTGVPIEGEWIAHRYRVERLLGEGAMGVVLLVTDMELKRECALEVLHASSQVSAAIQQRFEREATALASVNHPSVVVVYDRGTTQRGLPFIVMEYVDGVTCSTIVERASALGQADQRSDWLREFGITGRLEPAFVRQAMVWTLQLAQGLNAAHRAGIVHRDIKPSNVLIRRDGRAVLVDFGIAREVGRERLTRSGAIVGTPAYMAPEVLRGDGSSDERVDVYGLTATLYHLLTGQPPFAGGVHEVLAAVATRDVLPADKVRPGLSRDVQAILEHGLARSLKVRYCDMTALESDLDAFLNHRPLSVRPSTSLQRIARRAWRSSAFQVAVAATVLALAVWTWSALAEQRRAASRAAWVAGFPSLTTNLGFTSFERLRSQQVRDRLTATLDRLVASRYEPLVAFTLRGLFRIDQGDVPSGRADLALAADIAGTPFARELIARMVAAGATPTEARLAGLPPIQSADDVYLGLLLGLRARASEVVERLRSDPRALERRHAAEIVLMTEAGALRELARAGDYVALRELAVSIEERAYDLIRRDGYESALLGHVIALTHRLRGRPAEALQIWQKVLRAAPGSFPALQNAADCARLLGRLDAALEYCREAEAVVGPRIEFKLIEALAYAAADRPAEAFETLAELPEPKTPLEEKQQFDLRLRVESTCALTCLASRPEEAARIAREALARCERSAELGQASAPAQTVEVLRAIALGDRSKLFQVLSQTAVAERGSLLALKQAIAARPGPFTVADALNFAPFLDALPELLSDAPAFGTNR